MKKVAKVTHPAPRNSAPPRALDWLAPVIITVCLYFFQALSTKLFLVVEFGTPITLEAILSTLSGLTVLGLLFGLAPSPSPQQSKASLTFLAGGLVVTIPQRLIGVFVDASRIGTEYELLSNVASAAYSAVALALVIIGWLVLRGYPRSSLAWVAPLPFLVVSSRIIYVGWIVPLLVGGPFDPTLGVLIDVGVLFAQVGFVMFFATATVSAFQRAALTDGPVRNVPAIISFIFAFGLGVIAIITGHVALQQINERNERGGGFAIGGITIGWATSLATLCLLLLAFGKAFRV